MTGNKQKQKLGAWSGVCLLACAFGCGAQTDTGNTGSETHWLKSCDRDSECGEYSCLCGVCTRACDNEAQCDEVGNLASECTNVGSNAACDSETPERVCLKRGGSSAVYAGEQSSSGDSGTQPFNTTICDGSDDVRFIYRAGGGFVTPEHAFTGVYGERFLVLDGHCNFWGTNEAGVVMTGNLPSFNIVDDYQATEFGRLNRYDDLVVNWGCPDAGTTLVWDPSGSLYASQCGIPQELADVETTFTKAHSMVLNVLRAGTRSEGPLRFVITEPLGNEGDSELGWPLDLDPSEIAPVPNDQLGVSGVGLRFAAGARAQQLRNFVPATGASFRVEGPKEAIFYRVLVRDELPPHVAAALEARTSDASFKRSETFGQACSDDTECGLSLICQERTAMAGGDTACNTCVEPNDPEWLCRSNEDCCGDTVCCADCGEDSGKCIVEPDPCPTCLENGSVWIPPNECAEGCLQDVACYSNTCPGECSEGNCGACGGHGDCWAAGCTWEVESELPYCTETVIRVPDPEPCEVTATDPSLPGVAVHLEADSCTFHEGRGGQFRYAVTLDEGVEFTTESSDGSCGLCGVSTDAETWTQFQITNNDLSYCPECQQGCCPPTESVLTSLEAQTIEGTIDWPGLQWNGPSDTGNEPEGVFPPGYYFARVAFALPDARQVVAELNIFVSSLVSLTP